LKNNFLRHGPALLVPAFFIFFTLAVHAETVIEQGGAGRGLEIASDPPNAKIFIDGIERGRTPLVLEAVIAGTHTIRLEKDYYENWERSVSFSSDGRMRVSVDLVLAKGRVNLVLMNGAANMPVEPARDAGLELYVDGIIYNRDSHSGGASKLVLTLPEGRRTLLVQLFGYNEATTTVSVERGRILDVQLALEPAELRLENLKTNRKSVNPANLGALGSVILHFTVTRAGFGRFTVIDEDENAVFTRDFGDSGDKDETTPFKSWSQAVRWDGRDPAGLPLGEGAYTLHVELRETPFPAAGEGGTGGGGGGRDGDGGRGDRALSASVPVIINSDGETYPLSLTGGIAGLVNAAHSRTLPQGSFQAEAALLAGNVGDGEAAFSSLPFALGFRWTPLSTVEIGAAVNISPQFGGKVYAGVAFSAKKELRRAEKFVPGIALGLSGGWINGKTETEQGIIAGVGINGAFSWDLPGAFSVLCSPEFIWTGKDGHPDEAAPRMNIGGGILWRRSFAVAGLSLRSLCAFAGGERGFSPLKTSAEIRLYPPPSNFVAGAAAHCVITDGTPHFSGGLTIGFIF
jgi:hypothetical protein